MKNIFLFLLISFTLMVDINAQEYRKFKVGLGTGFTITGSAEPGDYTGVQFAIEPVYHINDDFTLGLRLAFADTHISIFGTGRPIGSYALNSQYYFGNKKFRPTVGAGVGWFVITSYYYIDTKYSITKFGFYPRAGFEYGHFYMAMEYNFIPPSEEGYYDNIKNSYFGMRLGFFIGGGRKTT
jgi:hypothetical protein